MSYLGMLAAVLCVTLSGCSKKKSNAEPGQTTASSAPAAQCEGAIKVEDPPFCVKAPPGYKPGKKDKTDDETSLEFENAETRNFFRVRWTDNPDRIAEIKQRHQPDSDPTSEIVEQGDLLGGKGHWFYSRWKKEVNGQRGSTIAVYVQGPKHTFICESASSADDEEQKKRLEVCKSIMPL